MDQEIIKLIPEAVTYLPVEGDPVVTVAKWFGLVVAAILVGLAPVMVYLRRFHTDRAHNARDAATAEVYEILRSQLREHGEMLQKSIGERASQDDEIHALKLRLAEVSVHEANQARLNAQLLEAQREQGVLRQKIDGRDEMLRTLSRENRRLSDDIVGCKNKIVELLLFLGKAGLVPDSTEGLKGASPCFTESADLVSGGDQEVR